MGQGIQGQAALEPRRGVAQAIGRPAMRELVNGEGQEEDRDEDDEFLKLSGEIEHESFMPLRN
jgi:hypothetical protein